MNKKSMEYNPKVSPCDNCGEMGLILEYEDNKAIEYKCVICNYKFYDLKNKYENQRFNQND
jgi:peptide subunit release factor 1 (eRF1)